MNIIRTISKNYPTTLLFAAIFWLIASWFTVDLSLVTLASVLGAILGLILEKISSENGKNL
ncbi:hypothetical protein SAMN05216302_10721 [Nitrosomonas aestuarii]|uniref:Uncharacterized protein n=1 Tax=Nitrosomonas aestuarii TaxID=52441 RepID=A0A1I4H678_9PROT|nr:hypothetical protein [Nitrosomonas aestuarii]SFL37675.1 hypothetical protein SAMN05216302_10721 [Nitrosomonas aestuarii]